MLTVKEINEDLEEIIWKIPFTKVVRREKIWVLLDTVPVEGKDTFNLVITILPRFGKWQFFPMEYLLTKTDGHEYIPAAYAIALFSVDKKTMERVRPLMDRNRQAIVTDVRPEKVYRLGFVPSIFQTG